MMSMPAHPGRHTLYNGSSGTFLPVKEGNEAMATVTFDNATRQYPGNPIPSVDKLNIEIADGEFLVLVGPSGCGNPPPCACSPASRRSTADASSSVTAT